MSGNSGKWSSDASSPNYRPLNVRDALSYLDQVKIQFQDQPDVYNRFLDVMKEFKSQIIDTPGVIDRVSTLFRGHPALIQGFNTFLPPGYRIECIAGGDGDRGGMITVTTPSGTVSQVPGKFAQAMREGELRTLRQPPGTRPPSPPAPAASRPGNTTSILSSSSVMSTGPPPLAPAANITGTVKPPAVTSTATRPGAIGSTVTVPASNQPTLPSGPSTPSAASMLASGMNNNTAPNSTTNANIAAAGRVPVLEFNHAISFVNRIKNRFSTDPDTYKQFLEILQTYQRDTKDIAEVYEQVTKLFSKDPDLIDEFKQFLPESGFGSLAGMGAITQAVNAPSAAQDKPAPPKRKEPTKEAAPSKKRKTADGKGKKGAKADSPSGEDGEPSTLVTGGPQTLVSADEVAFFDKVKKFIDDKYTYHEFLKLINLFSLDMLDSRDLLLRAELFIGQSPEIWTTFRKMVLGDEAGNVISHPYRRFEDYESTMINADNRFIENVPMLDRVKPDLSAAKVKSYGPSYRKLPRTEINLTCSGRDAMCWEVLNDEWVSHPTWAAEDAAPFMTHKKNAYEEALHKSEEERHEYDYHIEANLRTIALFEPLNNKIQTMDPEERAVFNLKAGLGGQSKSIYQRIIKKVYGKELGPEIIKAIHENPTVSLPIVLERLKAKDDEWKKAQREWNRVWREQDAKNFYKALDHQGVAFKQTDKKTLSAKNLINEVESRWKEQQNARASLINPMIWRAKPQFELEFKDHEVIKDVVKLVISYLDRVNNALTPSDKERIEQHLRDFVPLLFMLDKEEFDADFGDAEHGSDDPDNSDDSDGDVSMADEDETASNIAKKSRKAAPSDLRKRLLKQVQEKEAREQRGGTMTPGPEDPMDNADTHSVEGTPMTENGDRAETPLAVPDDPEAVAEAVEKDKADAEASEQTWVNVDMPASRDISEERPAEPKVKVSRRANFFCNNHYYILIRLIQILYSRLLACKEIANKLASEKKKPINPVAIKLGLAEPETQFFGIEDGENPAQHYYEHLLSMAERLFENEVDVATYEETLRLMFGTKAYTLFTLDRVVGLIVKQTQTVLCDMKCQEVFALLQRDRAAEKTSTRSQIAYRNQADAVIGDSDSLYKVVFHTGSGIAAISIMSKDDMTVDDAETAEEKWRNYIDSYVLTSHTEGLSARVDVPFLKRSVTADAGEDMPAGTFQTNSTLGMKFALRSYRMFTVPGGEDFFHRRYTAKEIESGNQEEEKKLENAKTKLTEWVAEKVQP